MAFTTDDDGNWVFNLDDSPSKKPVLENLEPDIPMWATPEKWRQYCSNECYEIDRDIRNWIAEKSKDQKWRHGSYWRRYTMSMVIEQLYGRKWDAAIDASRTAWYSRILAYYSTRIQKGNTTIRGGKAKGKVYTISHKRLEKPPYSLRLRVEWLADRGEIPTGRNMRMPKDNLKAGHARNPKTDANMARRREKAKAIYNERYKNRSR